MRCTRSQFVLLLTVVGLSAVNLVWAQDAATRTPTQAGLRQILSILVPMATTYGGPYLTGFIKRAPEPVKYGISAIVGILVGVLAGEFTDYPMNYDTAGLSGVTSSMIGQRLLHEVPPGTTCVHCHEAIMKV